ncbi:MAG: L,D-transpeptidase/peptidoglycan binding protein [Candidatus Nomurabacteria bacterium]|jgi:lipoprotein-anchoring transpeptidase ErfK/SrfK|nr:L,D-transpeptidase/peptidoglycan binding protein [Candidatus Nomurabacteria bacterium]
MKNISNNIREGFHHRLNKAKSFYVENPHAQAKHRAIFYGVLLGLLLLVLTVAGLYMVTYGDKASPATYLSGQDVSGKMRAEVKGVASNLYDKINLNLTNGEMVVNTKLADLGVTLDVDKTVDTTIDAGASRNIFVRFNPFVRKDTNLILSYDIDLMQAYLNEKFYEITTPPAEPIVAYDDANMAFKVVPGAPGKIVSAEKLRDMIEETLGEPRALSLKMDLSNVEPIVTDAHAELARDYINQRLGLRINMYHAGRLMYFIDPPDIASFVNFTPNVETHKFDIAYSDEIIKTFIDKKLAPSLTSAPVNERLLVNNSGETLMVLNQGRNGLAPGNIDGLVSQISGAVANNQGLDINLDLTEKKFETEKIVTEDNRWVEYNLANFTVTLWDGTTPIWSTSATAHGKPSSPTITGAFRVFQKLSVQTMTGGTAGADDFYSIPGVRWVTYWGPGGYAFHTASWLGGQEGTRISHGCVNMHEGDAKMVFDYVDVGTRVVVHW